MRMECREFAVDGDKYRLEAVLVKAGTDAVLVVTGGTRPHIGATAVATPRPSLTGKGTSASVSVLCQLGHRDDEFARGAARVLAIAWGCTVTVTVGIHVDAADYVDLELLQYNFQQLIEQVRIADDENGKEG